MRNIVGNVPDPEELYGRDALIEHLWRQIRGNNILLVAPRRFGKTGVMRHVLRLPRDGYLPVYLDVEDVDSPQEFVWRLTREVLALDLVRQTLSGIKSLPHAIRELLTDHVEELGFEGAKVKFRRGIEDGWEDAARKLLLELEKADATFVFIIDELPSMLEQMRRSGGEDQARAFVSWFRGVRLQQKDELRRHRFVVGGSIGIDLVLRSLQANDKLNDFDRLYVEPIQGAAARRLCKDLAESMEVGMGLAEMEAMLALIGPPVPYFIHLFFSQLGQLPPADRDPLTAAKLHEVYRKRILGPTCKKYFDHFRQRLGRYGPRAEKAAIRVLRAVALSERGRVGAAALYDEYRGSRKRDANELEFQEMMADLECEWYLALDPRTNEYHFLLDVVRDWWRRWYPSLSPARK